MNEGLIEFERIGGLFGLVLFLLLSSVSCDLPQASGLHSLRVSFPVLAECWSELALDGFELSWRDEKGTHCSAFVKAGEEFDICVQRGIKQCILAYPVMDSRCFRPLGALYPYDVAAENVMAPSGAQDLILLSADSGYVALIAEALQKSGFDPWAFALDELAEVWEERACDPWQLSPCDVAEKLATGTFKETVFSTKTQEVELPQGRTWVPESPFTRMRMAGEKQYAALNTGVFKFLAQGASLVVRISEDKEAIIQVSGS